jgi:hypothetical protein
MKEKLDVTGYIPQVPSSPPSLSSDQFLHEIHEETTRPAETRLCLCPLSLLIRQHYAEDTLPSPPSLLAPSLTLSPPSGPSHLRSLRGRLWHHERAWAGNG